MSLFVKSHQQLLKINKNTCIVVAKNFSQKNDDKLSKRYEEIKIPTPNGHIAGRWWGPQDVRPVLCFHGWQESCASFDPIFNLLPENYSLLALDFPGSGLSSKLPPGVFYHDPDTLILYRRIQKYFNWKKIAIMGHSMGGIVGGIYSSLFPDDVEYVIGIDGLKPPAYDPGTFMKATAKHIDQFLTYEALNEADTESPAYTIEEISSRMYEGTMKSVKPENCKYLLERSLKRSTNNPNKYQLTRDNRVKVGQLIGLQHTDILHYARQMKCPTLYIKATNGPWHGTKKQFQEYVEQAKKNENFELVYVEGTHHVHINEPEKVVGLVECFLKKHYKIDRSSGGIKPEMKLY